MKRKHWHITSRKNDLNLRVWNMSDNFKLHHVAPHPYIDPSVLNYRIRYTILYFFNKTHMFCNQHCQSPTLTGRPRAPSDGAAACGAAAGGCCAAWGV